ncbi:hypothetical protein L798_01783 [Zootermopsis nevadensis]|uniref:Uncharacterized protein n=2 Tax=Zootermopsis nevadensis TaxID=136037 RepID=A0A067QI62_ZOONE|nr:hypothetical protein L798_01783 [Zootermopsis nevadensis]
MIDFGEVDVGYSDMQTVFLACIATLLPLMFILVVAIGVRFLWRRCHARKGEGYEGVLQRDESSGPLAVKSLSVSGNLLSDELKTSESQFSMTPGEEIEYGTSQSPLLSFGTSSRSLPNHTSKSANGSIITMTLKNNHLIVETQETEVTLGNGSTKTMTTKFTTSSSPNENNVFVVEVQQSGAARSSDSDLYPKLSSSAVSSQEDIDEEDGSRRSSSQRAQVHRPPDMDVDEVSVEDMSDELEDEEDEDTEEDMTERKVTRDGTSEDDQDRSANTNTGLSQSDLSISSSGSNNPSYRYGNQVGYEGGHFGYPQYVGYTASDEKAKRTAGGGKLVVPRWNNQATAEMKRASSVTDSSDKVSINRHLRGRYSIDVTPVSGRLLSDIQAIERRRQLQEDERLQEEQRQLGNGSVVLAVANGITTPPSVNDKMEDSQQDGPPAPTELDEKHAGAERISDNKSGVNLATEPEGDKPATEAKDKKFEEDCVSAPTQRSPLSVITPELYTQIKQTTKSLILDKATRPGLSPKFEKFRNENSPLDEIEKSVANDSSEASDTAPVKSQEYENKAFVPSDQITS